MVPRTPTPKPWSDMSRNDRWYLEAYWSGSLRTEMRRAESKCSKVQAKFFVVNEEAPHLPAAMESSLESMG